MLNDIDINENEFEEAAVDEMEKERIKKNLKKSIRRRGVAGKKKVIAAAAITFVCITSVMAVEPTLAKNIPIINQLFKQDLISINKQYADYIDTIGKTKSCEGIDVTFESAAADDNKLFLNFIVKNNNKEIKDDYTDALLIPTSMKVNGKSVSTGAGASWEFIDNNTIRVLKKIDWSQDKVPNKMNIDIDITELYGKSGDWGVHFFLDKSNQAEKTVEEKINVKLDINGVNGKISTVIISPLTVTIKGEGDFEDMKNNSHLDFIVLDDKGNKLSWDGSSGGTKGVGHAYKWSSTFISNENMKSVTIIPAYKTGNVQDTKKLPVVNLDVNNVKPIELTIDKDRSINIKDYLVDGEYLIVKYNEKYFDKEASRGIFDIPVYITADGIEVKEASADKRDELYSKYGNSKDKVDIFEIGTSRKLMIGTYDGSNVKILKDKSFTVDIKK